MSKLAPWMSFMDLFKKKEAPTKTSQKGIELIKEFEGCRLEAYLDSVRVETVGYGHTGPDVYMGLVITREKAEALLQGDLKKFETGVMSLVKVKLNQNQFDALVSFSFNLGLNNLRKSTLLLRLNNGDYAVGNEFEKWNKAGTVPLAGLTRRRKAERELFECVNM
jgi:lysozyme